MECGNLAYYFEVRISALHNPRAMYNLDISKFHNEKKKVISDLFIPHRFVIFLFTHSHGGVIFVRPAWLFSASFYF